MLYIYFVAIILMVKEKQTTERNIYMYIYIYPIIFNRCILEVNYQIDQCKINADFLPNINYFAFLGCHS